MGNSSTKEQRNGPPPPRELGTGSHLSNSLSLFDSSRDRSISHSAQQSYAGRAHNDSRLRPDFLSTLGLGAGVRDASSLEARRETKQEREARKLEKERVNRLKERERSMRDEHVDGGYLVTQGVYTGIEDYNKARVRQLMIERRIAPFWRGLNDHQDSWTENQLVAAAKGLPIPPADEIPKDEKNSPLPIANGNKMADTNIEKVSLPILTKVSNSMNEESLTSSLTGGTLSTSLPSPASDLTMPQSNSTLTKARSRTLASLDPSGRLVPLETQARETSLPENLHVNGQRLEAHLYKDVIDCSICYLYYPPYLNKTRCCDQAICSECFVQIKRPDPHRPEHADPTGPTVTATEALPPIGNDSEFISEPAACPFCRVPEFGITYEPPSFRRGLIYANQVSGNPFQRAASGMSSSTSSLVSTDSNSTNLMPPNFSRRRATSVSANSNTVVTTDQVRPDWAEKLATARAHNARRSAAATALHTAAYLMGDRRHEADVRSFGSLGRRGMLRRPSGGEGQAFAGPPAHLGLLSLLSERQAMIQGNGGQGNNTDARVIPGPRDSSRRGRLDDLEDMMMMEAIRLSLAAEEERQRKEDKEAKKESKKKEKENRKAEKAARKGDRLFGIMSSSSSALDLSETSSTDNHEILNVTRGEIGVESSTFLSSGDLRSKQQPERNRSVFAPDGALAASPYSSTPRRPSHLRAHSNVSSPGSSNEGSGFGTILHDPREPGSSADASPAVSGINIAGGESSQVPRISSTPPGNGADTEPMFNFQSLAALVGEDEKTKDTSHHESAIGAGHVSSMQRDGQGPSELR